MQKMTVAIDSDILSQNHQFMIIEIIYGIFSFKYEQYLKK